jgi:tape measure domain-containing protein
MSEFIEVISKQSLEQLDELIKKLNIATGEVKEFNNISKQIKVPSEATEQIKKTTKATQKLTEAQKEAQRLSRALERQKERLIQATSKENKELITLRYETQKTNREQKQLAIISSRLSTEYEKQQAKINLLSERYRELATRQQLGIRLSKDEERELKDVTNQINRKQSALKKVDANMQVYNRNVGNYKSAWKGVGGLIRTSIMAFGAFAAVDIAREIFNQTKEINKLNASLKQVTFSQAEFNQAIEFLTGLADRAGTNVNKLQGAYTKFLASARVTNLTLQETQEIFENVAIASGLMGLTTEDTEGAFRALEQMLSKGKVQAEEIRGQLGERLPGAFVILAKSMGLTTAQLDKQLELGQVYAEEVLPKFAKELAKTYSFDNVTRVDTLAASQARLGNEWNAFIRDLEGGQGVLSGVFKGLIDGLSFLISKIREISDLFSNVFASFEPIFRNIKEQFELVFGEEGTKQIQKFFGTVIKFMSNATWKLFGYTLKGIGATINGMLNSTWQLAENIAMIARSMGGLIIAFKNFDFLNPIESAKNVTDAQVKLLATFAVAGQNLGKSFKDGFNEVWDFQAEAISEDAEIPQVTEKAKKQGRELAKAIQEGLKSAEAQDLNILGDSFKTWEKEQAIEIINWFRDLPEEVLNGSNELDKWANKVTEATLKLRELAKAQKEVREIFLTEFASLGQMLNIDTSVLVTAFDTLQQKGLEFKDSIAAIAPAVGEIFSGIGQTIFQNEQIRLQNQLALNSEYYNNLIEQASGNAEQQELLRREQASKERQIRQKQAENEKKNAQFSIAIDTAVS